MASQDQMTKLKEKFKQQPQFIFIAVLAVLLVARILVFLNEASFTGGAEIKPSIIVLKPELTITSPEYTNVDNLLPPPPELRKALDASMFKDLLQTDIFDPVQAQSALANRPAADRMVTDGYAALGRDDLEEAKRNALEALKLVANNRGALDLQRNIAKKLVTAGYVALESENKDLDLARSKAEEALAVVPEFGEAIELQAAIEKASQPNGARNLMGSGLMTPGASLPGADTETTKSAMQE